MVVSRAALLTLLLVSCTSSKAITPDEPRTAAPRDGAGAAATPAPTDAPVAREDRPPQKAQHRAPEPAPLALGAPCDGSDAKRCGTRGRVAVTYEAGGPPGRKRKSVPCALASIKRSSAMHDMTSACVDADRLYVLGVCLICRMDSDWLVTGVVPEMSDAQLVEVQQRMGLPADPPIRTPSAWRDAIAANAAKPGDAQ